MAREFYMASTKKREVENIQLHELDMRDELETRPIPSEELEPIQLGEDLGHLVYIWCTWTSLFNF